MSLSAGAPVTVLDDSGRIWRTYVQWAMLGGGGGWAVILGSQHVPLAGRLWVFGHDDAAAAQLLLIQSAT